MLRILLGRFYPYVQILVGRIVISYYAALAWYQSRGKQPFIHAERDYAGQKILLVALYEKGTLRSDMRHVMATAKNQGYYVIAVNTLRLGDPQAILDVCDCYIERPNYGRDFGSYQTGFLHVYDRDWHLACPRLLMLNDSNYFSKSRVPSFLSDMMSSEQEVLGSTENYEIQHHLGSFCIAMAGTVLRHQIMERFWREYRLSDIRPKVIRRGEVGLTKALKRVASSPDQVSALYSAARFADALHKDRELLQFTVANARRSNLVWKNTGSPRVLTQQLLAKYSIVPNPALSAGEDEAKLRWVSDYPTLMSAIGNTVDNPEQIVESSVDRALIAELVDNFIRGSQIHQNGAILLKMGLPLIKLDAVYRGAANTEDIEIMMSELDPSEAPVAREMLLQRPYGREFLYGWRLGAFVGGYL